MANERMPLKCGAEYIISKLESHGFRADVVGGCVRDFLIGKNPSDYDITTSATPDEMKDVFSADKFIETGIKHGTLTVLIDGEPYEVTTYRIDGEYDDARHPRSVEFSRKIEDDLSRRDFTVNAMAYSPRFGVTDLFGGKEDLKRGVIKAVGIPEERFAEDALRILRALRFASDLDFKIEKKTSLALIRLADNISFVSAERIYVELKKLIAGQGAYRILTEYRGVIEKIIPRAANYSLPERELFDKASHVSRFAALFAEKNAHDIKEAFIELRSDLATRELVAALVSSLGRKINASYDIKILLTAYPEQTVREIIAFRSMMSRARIDEAKLLSSVLESGECYKLSMLSIGGKELVSLGINGPAVGEALSYILDSVMRGEVKNEREELIRLAVKMKK